MAIISLVVGPKDPSYTSESLGMPTGSKKALGSNPITTFFSYNTCMYTLFINLKQFFNFASAAKLYLRITQMREFA